MTIKVFLKNIQLIVFIIVSFLMIKAYSGEHELSFTELKSLIEKENVLSIDQLIPLLPDVIRKNTLLTYDSHALNLDRVSFETPRMIFFNKDASLILAMTRNPGESIIASGGDKLEVIAFNKELSEFEMFDIVFDGKTQPLSNPLQKNPKSCVLCHGQNPRPIFEDYNGWAGFYGSYSQQSGSSPGTKEEIELSQFITIKDSLERYKNILNNFVKIPNFRHIRQQAVGYGELASKLKFGPHIVFGASVEMLMLEKLSAKIERNEESKLYKNLFAYLGRSEQCGSHRTAYKEIFSSWYGSTENKQLIDQVSQSIEQKILKDFAAKKQQFDSFNVVDPTFDKRGLFNIPYGMMIGISSKYDKAAFMSQILILEGLAKVLNLSNEDFSTVPSSTTGIFHVRSAVNNVTSDPLFYDEQIFKGIHDRWVARGSEYITETNKLNCNVLKELALSEVLKLPVPTPSESGVFF